MSEDKIESTFDPELKLSVKNSNPSTDALCFPFDNILDRSRRRKHHSHSSSGNRDFLFRLFEKKKLKDKSLSKKMKTPFDRKINRTCWPVELHKVSKIKKKPREKKLKKPTHKSLTTRRVHYSSNKNVHELYQNNHKAFKGKSPSAGSSRSGVHTEDSYDEILRNLNTSHFLYEPVTPEMLIEVLQEPELLKSGATLRMIISKLRALKLELNPAVDMLKKEVLRKLDCAKKLGLIIENQGYYKIAETLRMSRLPRKKVNAFWEMYRRATHHCRCKAKH